MVESTVESSSKLVVGLTEKVPIRMLHVDDDAGFLKVAKQLLEMQGAFEVDTALSVKEAVEKLKAKTFDAVVSDYQMPERDGLDFLRELRDKGDNVPFIMFTGRGREEVAIEALNLGADQYLNKTGDPEAVYGELAHSIRRIVKAKHDEERLRESEEKYRSIFENANDVTLTLDLKGKITSINKAAVEYGFRKDEVIGRNMLKYTPKKYWPRLLKDLAQLARGKNVEGKIEIVTPKGKKQAEYWSNPILVDGKVVGVQSILKDVTERKRAEETLRDRQRKLAALFDNVPAMVYLFDENGVFLETNEKLGLALGKEKEEIVGKKIHDLFPEEQACKYLEDGREVLRTGKPKRNILEQYDTQEGTHWALTDKIPYTYPSGRTAVLGFSKDITERKKIEEALEQNMEQQKILLSSIPAYIYYKDTESRLIAANKAFAEMVNTPIDQLPGKTAYDLFPKEQAERFHKDDKEVMETGKPKMNIEEKYTDATGKTRWASTSKIPYFDEEAKMAGMVGITWDITERKQAEGELIRLSNAVKMSIDSIVISDLHGKIIDVNDATLRMYGTNNKGDLVGKSSFDLIAAEDREKALAGTKEVLEKGYVKNREYNIITKDGGRVPVEMSVAIMKDKDGKSIGFVGINRDTTERKKAEKSLQESEEKYRLLIESSDAAITFFDRNGTYLFLNKIAAGWLDGKPEDYVGKTVYDAFPKDAAEMFVERFRRIMKSGVAETIEERVESLDLWTSSNLQPVRDQNGNVIGVQIVTHDVTERRKAEEELRSSEDRLKVIFEFAPDAFYLNDLKGNFMDGNKAAEELTGYTRSELIGKSFLKLKLLSRKQVMKAAKLLVKNALGKSTGPDEFVLNRKDGTPVPVEIRTFPVKIKDQTLVLGIARDISERKRTEEALKTMNEKLRVVGKLTRHDVRNKLSAVTGNVFLAKRKLPRSHEALEYLSEIEPAIRQVEEIFDFARTYERLGIEGLAYINVEKTVKETVSLFSDLQGVKLVNDCRGLKVLADSLLRRLFYNLIDNSLKHGEKVSQIRVHYEEAGKDRLKLVYEDDGIGIPAAEKEKIFREGYGKGTGYGLYLIARMCEVYGWNIQETGKHGKGAQFTITMPRKSEGEKMLYKLH